MVKEGADILDIGGESSRPGSKRISEEEEIERVIPLIKKLKGIDITISIDTTKFKVAELAFKHGARILNDISAARWEPEVVEIVKDYNGKIVLMHMKGMPEDMQINPYYDDVLQELSEFFEERIEFCLNRGLREEQLIIDPGIGFGKRLEDNLKIIANIDYFKKFKLPIFVGPSRKSYIGKITGAKAEKRLAGTLATVLYLASKGIDYIRVHDVYETVQALKVYQAIKKEEL